MALTAKQARFVAEYLVDLNKTQAAIRAGYSPKTAESQGSRLSRNAQVQAAIDAGTIKKAAAVGITAESVLNGLVRVTSKAEDVGELGNALKGLELQGKHLKLFTDRIEVKDDGSFAALLKAARQRAGR